MPNLHYELCVNTCSIHTDLPLVVSQKYVAIIDPHRRCVKKNSETAAAGTRKKLTNFFSHKSHAATFELVFGIDTKAANFSGTVFRFPLRKIGSHSEICDKVYTPEMVKETLFESLKAESPYMLIFLKNIKSVSLREWTNGKAEPIETFRIDVSKGYDVVQNTIKFEELEPDCQAFARQCSQNSDMGTSNTEVYLKIESLSVSVVDKQKNTPDYPVGRHHWLVLNVVGSNDDNLNILSKELSILPWVGVATRLPEFVALDAYKTTITNPFTDTVTVQQIFDEFESILNSCKVAIKWKNEDARDTKGHAYCFLPLPECTAMAVHVHGYFAVTDNRRSIKWPAHDEKGKEAQWNRELLQKMVAPAYALLLACRSNLVHYEDSPLPVAHTESVTDAYSTWPLYSEVKNVHIWNELLKPTLSFCASLPLLWTPAGEGRWVQFNEARFPPSTNSSTTSSQKTIAKVIQHLIALNIPVVILPKVISETINQQLKDIVDKQEITPHFVRGKLRNNLRHCSELSKDDIYSLLEFVLSDLTKTSFDELVGIPLLPLLDGSIKSFSKSADQNSLYIFPIDMKKQLNLIPRVEHLVVDPNLPETTTKTLCDAALTGNVQIKKVDTEIMCKHLLPQSIKSWCAVMDGSNWIWTPSTSGQPPESWANELWKWIAENSESLPLLESLPIVVELQNKAESEQGLVLKKLLLTNKLCRLPVLLSSNDRLTIMAVLAKFGFTVVDESKMNRCDKLTGIPDFEKLIPQLSPNLELLIQHLRTMCVSDRIRDIQKLHSEEKDFLRQRFRIISETELIQYRNCLRSLPIFHAASHTQLSCCFVSLDGVNNSVEAFLPPDGILPLPECPSSMLSTLMDTNFLKALSVPQLSLDELCEQHLIPKAVQHIQASPNTKSKGDELVVWMLKQRDLSRTVLDLLSTHDVIFTLNQTHKQAKKTYNPHDKDVLLLFDTHTDGNVFPDSGYFQDSSCECALMNMGMQTWKSLQNDPKHLNDLLCERMLSVQKLELSHQISRGEFILQVLADFADYKLDTRGNRIPFLRASSCPEKYPPCMKEEWFSQTGKLYSIEDLILPAASVEDLVGTIKPVLSRDYCSKQSSLSSYSKLSFQSVGSSDVLKQLAKLEGSSAVNSDIDSVVMTIYEYMHRYQGDSRLHPQNHSMNCKLQKVWWNVAEPPVFLPAERFIQNTPMGLSTSLEPYFYSLKGTSLWKYADLFDLHPTPNCSQVYSVLRKIKEDTEEKGVALSHWQIEMCTIILSWLHKSKYIEKSGMLMITRGEKLQYAVECVFDDRSWLDKGSKQIKAKSLTFVHHRIISEVAKYFHVKPLSRVMAKSEKLSIKYKLAGQHESITNRIRHIVEDYGTTIDIFKELLQNADDAGATEVKFLIDWRNNPSDPESLFAEELKVWQGPALIAYNNVTFSDSDFDNICKVAGETKKDDPLKTGRFGVGFCATYHLTDLPSFISRRYFTMFDPHTIYLGDRVSPQAPGMRIDLVESQDELELYLDQFFPYDGIFGCNIFELDGDGYQGTLFRFPFRSGITSSKSEICKEEYNDIRILDLRKALKDQCNELLLFLKHVNAVSLYELKDGGDPKNPREIFSVERSGDISERLQLIRGYKNNKEMRTCSTEFVIDVNDHIANTRSTTTWIISSAMSSASDGMMSRSEAKGLLPLAEIAQRMEKSRDYENMNLPALSKYEISKAFCFLPLPIVSPLPFHINGFFIISKDRRNIMSTDDATFGSLWNKSLAEGALVQALICLLSALTKLSDIPASSVGSKWLYLKHYYSLWELSSADGPIGRSFREAFKKHITLVTLPIIWSEIRGGCWLPPSQIAVFKDDKLNQMQREHEQIVNDATTLLLAHGQCIVDIPSHILILLKTCLEKNNKLYNYQRFCQEILFKEITKVSAEVRVRNITFLVEQFESYTNHNTGYEWAEHFLSTTSSIPCQSTNVLKPTTQLIDPTKPLLQKLFDVSEGRFPSENLQNSPSAMQGLRRLGMASWKMSIDDLRDRAQSVSSLDYEFALERSNNICNYIKSTYGERASSSDPQELKEISDIAFLPVKQVPKDTLVPWKGEPRSFSSPMKLYSPEHEYLIFSQHPIVEIGSDYRSLLRYLNILSKELKMDMVVAHLRCISGIKKSDLNETTVVYLDNAMTHLYCHLNSTQFNPEQLKKLGKFIWQNGHFLHPSQLLFHWSRECFPYLCELSTTNRRFKPLMEKVGVKQVADLERLLHALQLIADDNGTSPLSDKTFGFVEHIASEVEKRLKVEKQTSSKIYLPDENKIMRKVSELGDNVGSDWVRNSRVYQDYSGYFVHKSIPRDRAVKLGVKPLLDALFKDIEEQDFLSGTDYGQHEDLCDRLNGILKKYPPDESIFKEFIQNADDAQATEIVFILDHRTKFPDNKLFGDNKPWKALQHTPALCIFNNRKFTDSDIEGIAKLGRGGKGGSAEMIGKFGIGFNVAYHVTDCPSFVSYGETGVPEYFCVFDPTLSFAPQVNKRSPGKKWKIKHHYIEVPDQFEPYLAKDLPKLAKYAPKCLLEHRKHGYVVFRLPLNRYRVQALSELRDGHIFAPNDVTDLFEEFAKTSKDMILFLNHLKSISAFEIRPDGTYQHNFTTSASIPPHFLKSYHQFSAYLRQYSEKIKRQEVVDRVTTAHQVTIIFAKTICNKFKKPSHCKVEKSQWLVQRAVGGRSISSKLLKLGQAHGLQPIGGVATMINAVSGYSYRLFCFLPLPIQSKLPVHVNGHFLVDDSRKHLETIKELEQWNESISQHVIVPSYVDLIIETRDMLSSRDGDVKGWFYSLFPRQSARDQGGGTGELDNLHVVQYFYTELLKRNPSVLLREMHCQTSSLKLSWMPVRSSLFCVQIILDKKYLTISDNLRTLLVHLGMPITSAPVHIYKQCVSSEEAFSKVARVEPNKVVEHLSKMSCTQTQKEMIKASIQDLLQYCISGCQPRDVQQLFTNALFLVAKDETLRHSYLFKTRFSDLLPQCSHEFVDKKLEESDVGKLLGQMEYNVIRPLPIEFVSKYVALPRTSSSHNMKEVDLDIVKLLWDYLILNHVAISQECPIHLFNSMAIIPASDGKLYPPCMSKVLVKESIDTCTYCSVMKKLGYPQIQFNKIKPFHAPTIEFILKSYITCFTSGQDIVNCLKMLKPPNCSVKLTDNEATAFASLLGNVSISNLQQVSSYLCELPLFHTSAGTWISLKGYTTVFILSSSDIPLDGIPTTYKGQVVLKSPKSVSPSIEKFYEGVIPPSIRIHVSCEEFYIQVILPTLHKLDIQNIKKHVKYLHKNKQVMKLAFDKLIEIAFIQHNGEVCKVDTFCDHSVHFFKTFKPEYLLPKSWQTELEILKDMGLKTAVTTDEWLQCAKTFSKKLPLNNKILEHKSNVLLNELIGMISKLGEVYRNEFLQDASSVEFVYSPQILELQHILFKLFPGQKNFLNDCLATLVKMKGSVLFKDADNACLCKTVLPQQCEALIKEKKVLQIEFPISRQTVSRNLILLCTCINSSCARERPQNVDAVKRLIKIIEGHYACLNREQLPPDEVCELKDTMCILLQKESNLLHLVKPNQLVMILPSGCSLEPYCYRVEEWLRKYDVFLKALGVKEELTASDYVNILQSIHSEYEGDTEASHVSHSCDSIIVSAYNELIRRLRQGDTLPEDAECIIYLPDKNKKLTKATELCFNDAPWYVDRLPSDCNFRIIHQPLCDDKGHQRLPSQLASSVRQLSNVVSERIVDECKSFDVHCTEEELHALGKRNERCPFVQGILSTIKSDQLCHGLCRIYYTEYSNPPPSTFLSLVDNLKHVEIRCITVEITTELWVNGKVLKGSKDSDKLCHLSTEDSKCILYIAPHIKSFDVSSFLKDLAYCMVVLLDSSIKNEAAISAMFECEPNEIPHALDKVRISAYSQADSKQPKSFELGASVPSKLTPSEQDAVIIVNFNPEDQVHYLHEDHSWINAKVVKYDQKEYHPLDFLDRTLTIKVREDKAESSEPDDSDSDGCQGDADTTKVSPMQVVKLLTFSQKQSLWGKGSSPYASPVSLASVPTESASELHKWVQGIFESRLFMSYGDILPELSMRLLVHLHYVLVIQRKAPDLYNHVSLVVHKCVSDIESTSTSRQHSDDETLDMLTRLVEKLTLEAVVDDADGDIDEQSQATNVLPQNLSHGMLRSTPAADRIVSRNRAFRGCNWSISTGSNCSLSHQSSQCQAGNATSNRYQPVIRKTNPAPSMPNQRFVTAQRRGHRNPRVHRFQQVVHSNLQPPPVQPNTCLKIATAWLEQAKADFMAAKYLLQRPAIEDTTPPSAQAGTCGDDVNLVTCKFPALVCFLCHDTVEKCIKGVLYAYCGLKQNLLNCSSLMMLHEELSSSPHCPSDLTEPIKECVMSVNRHENRSRFPNYQNSPCAPATAYDAEDASEATRATGKLLHVLQSKPKLQGVLGDLTQLPVARFLSSLKSTQDGQGNVSILV